MPTGRPVAPAVMPSKSQPAVQPPLASLFGSPQSDVGRRRMQRTAEQPPCALPMSTPLDVGATGGTLLAMTHSSSSRAGIANPPSRLTNETGHHIRGKRSVPSLKKSHQRRPDSREPKCPHSNHMMQISELIAAATAMVLEVDAIKQLVNNRDADATAAIAALAKRINGQSMAVANRLGSANRDAILHLLPPAGGQPDGSDGVCSSPAQEAPQFSDPFRMIPPYSNESLLEVGGEVSSDDCPDPTLSFQLDDDDDSDDYDDQ